MTGGIFFEWGFGDRPCPLRSMPKCIMYYVITGPRGEIVRSGAADGAAVEGILER
jgi:hypothetical protein